MRLRIAPIRLRFAGARGPMSPGDVIVLGQSGNVARRDAPQRADVRVVSDLLVVLEPDEPVERDRRDASAIQEHVVAIADRESLGARRLLLQLRHEARGQTYRIEKRVGLWFGNLHCVRRDGADRRRAGRNPTPATPGIRRPESLVEFESQFHIRFVVVLRVGR